ncbi:30S ribosomal protein S13 [Candidatus Saccharibacteria bacterium RIFCSPLOWO2_01_FULL_48_13]|nr:MAG: 30S ribosomal protein S13 [Candidatus Saccharibacteria bacterium RIFCSPHIGHO2_01_FULL_48_12]OGL35320.1 MAG: 30S ribosomal protein S13 [Candidatus Saccharibacteria bacterium RIFCSPHIGHO2_12_FULL_48_21]OGL37555.1 MAG: 30S ribosomal protein S13 [Candidatus Saccharibacteria bacterium RIFCSPLOWO2_01_FULL_48_13]
MARFSGVVVPSEKQIQISLTYIYGIGPKFSADILKKTGVEPTTRTKDLTDAEVSKIQDAINSSYNVEGELQRTISGNIKRLQDIGAYRGLRHKANLPSRGQRTKTNARTRRGRKITVAGTAKKAPAKT